MVDWNARFQDRPIYIKFQFFNWDFENNLYEFDLRLRLPHGGVWTVGHENFNVQSFWCGITCEKRDEVYDKHGSRVAYSASGSKATSICSPTLWYLHRIIANTVFTRHESQSRARLSEVYLICYILMDERFDTNAFILSQLVSQAVLPKSLIASGGLITAMPTLGVWNPKLGK